MAESTQPQLDPEILNRDGEFDVDLFNQQFEDARTREEARIRAQEEQQLQSLSRIVRRKKIHELTLAELIFNMKDAVLGTLNDLLKFNVQLHVFTKNDRLFYWGFLILLMVLVYYLFISMRYKDKCCDPHGKAYQKAIFYHQ